MISETDILIRLGIAFVFGAIIGFEREHGNQPAGLRTNIILVMGAALAMIVSITLAYKYPPVAGGTGDPARLAAQVVSGVGFLGAGAILHYGANIRGLTTAATIWTMAIVGLAVGAGYFLAGGVVTGFLFITLTVLDKIEDLLFHSRWIVPITLWVKEENVDLVKLRNLFQKKHLKLLSISEELNLETNETTINLEFSCRREILLIEIQKQLMDLPGLYKIYLGKTIGN